MKALSWIGMVLLALGVLSIFVPIPRSERAGVEAGGISVGVTTRHKETVSPVVSGALILAGAGLAIAGRRKSG
jgi:small-conductance mechanosensitive channel